MSDVLNSQADAILTRLEEQTGKPLRAMLEVSDRCNEVCLHCYQVQGQKGEMTTAQVKSVMDELAQMGVLIITISGGEATLRHDFIELLEHARKLGFAVRLFTNGLTMTRALALEQRNALFGNLQRVRRQRLEHELDRRRGERVRRQHALRELDDLGRGDDEAAAHARERHELRQVRSSTTCS